MSDHYAGYAADWVVDEARVYLMTPRKYGMRQAMATTKAALEMYQAAGKTMAEFSASMKSLEHAARATQFSVAQMSKYIEDTYGAGWGAYIAPHEPVTSPQKAYVVYGDAGLCHSLCQLYRVDRRRVVRVDPSEELRNFDKDELITLELDPTDAYALPAPTNELQAARVLDEWKEPMRYGFFDSGDGFGPMEYDNEPYA